MLLVGEKIKNIGEVTNELFKNGITVNAISSSASTVEAYFIEKMEG